MDEYRLDTYEKFVKDMVQKYYYYHMNFKNENGITVVAKYPDILGILQELLSYGFEIEDIDFQTNFHEKGYYLELCDNILSVTPAYHGDIVYNNSVIQADYKIGFPDVAYFFENIPYGACKKTKAGKENYIVYAK